MIQNIELKNFLNHFTPKADFDSQTFHNLYQDTNEETVIRILAHFNENLKESIKILSEALKKEDCESVWKCTHKIAGSAELLGFKRLAELSQKLSKQIRANPVFEYYTVEIYIYIAMASEINQQIENKFKNLKSFL